MKMLSQNLTVWLSEWLSDELLYATEKLLLIDNARLELVKEKVIINQIQFSGWISALESSPASWLSNFYCARNIFNIEISQQGTSGEGLEGLLLSLGLCHWNSNCFCWQKSLAGDLHKFVLPVGSIGFWFNKWQILQIWILWMAQK